MKRGGILLLIIIILIVILSIAAFFVISGNFSISSGSDFVEPPQPVSSTIVVLAQPLGRDDQITPEALAEIPYPAENITPAMFRSIADVPENAYAKYPLVQGQPLTRELISDRPGAILEGSQMARKIPPGMTAISIPISRLSAVGFAIQDGDFVNVIATTKFVDLDTSFQSILPNNVNLILGPAPLGTTEDELPKLTVSSGSGESIQGRAELEPTLGQAIYFTPAESQRPRLVSQMILQNIQVLHIGSFNVNGETTAAPADPAVEGEQEPPPDPDIITLIVSPQDAVSLTYLLHSKVALTLTLRYPEDPNTLSDPESVTLQYLISQYNIALPAKLPFGMIPLIEESTQPAP